MNKYIKYNQNKLAEIKKAERQKTSFENKGYCHQHTFINSISGEVTLTYATNFNTN